MQISEITTVFKIVQFHGRYFCGNTSVVTESYSIRYAQYCLLTILEKRKFAVDRKKIILNVIILCS